MIISFFSGIQTLTIDRSSQTQSSQYHFFKETKVFSLEFQSWGFNNGLAVSPRMEEKGFTLTFLFIKQYGCGS